MVPTRFIVSAEPAAPTRGTLGRTLRRNGTQDRSPTSEPSASLNANETAHNPQVRASRGIASAMREGVGILTLLT